MSLRAYTWTYGSQIQIIQNHLLHKQIRVRHPNRFELLTKRLFPKTTLTFGEESSLRGNHKKAFTAGKMFEQEPKHTRSAVNWEHCHAHCHGLRIPKYCGLGRAITRLHNALNVQPSEWLASELTCKNTKTTNLRTSAYEKGLSLSANASEVCCKASWYRRSVSSRFICKTVQSPIERSPTNVATKACPGKSWAFMSSQTIQRIPYSKLQHTPCLLHMYMKWTSECRIQCVCCTRFVWSNFSYNHHANAT